MIYSLDCNKWALLPIATDELKILCSRIKGRFAGDPSYEYEHVEIRKVPGENGEENEEETTVRVSEISTQISNIYAESLLYISLRLE